MKVIAPIGEKVIYSYPAFCPYASNQQRLDWQVYPDTPERIRHCQRYCANILPYLRPCMMEKGRQKRK